MISDAFRKRYLSDPKDPDAFEGRAVVFDGPEDYHRRIDDPALKIDEQHHPVHARRRRHRLSGLGRGGEHAAAGGAASNRASNSLPCIGDGRQSGTSGSPSILNASPEAAANGGLALLKTGDRVRIDLRKGTADILISNAELAKRRAALAKNGGYPYPESQTPWQEIQRGMVDQLAEGMVLKPAVKFQRVAQTSAAAQQPLMEPPCRRIADKRKTFRKLHESGCFVIPNPWDVGSARYLQHLGFKAIASTSAGFAFAQARPDGAVPRDMMLAHLHELAHASDLPLNADFEAGYADDLAGVAESVRLCVETGVSGLSIEDGADRKLYSIDDAVARLRAARGAIDKAGGDVMLVGRAECFLLGRPDIEETDRAAEGLFQRRRRLPLCARPQDPRADRGGGQGGRARSPST